MDAGKPSNAPGSSRVLDLPKAPNAIELRHLRFFVAVAEELNFTRAADRLFVTQPALSRQIRNLERLLGVELLRRSTHRVELTVAGEALLNRTRPMLADLDEAVVQARGLGGENQQRLARLTQPVIDQMLTGLDEFRQAFEAMNAQFPTPEGISVRPLNAGGIQSLVYGADPAPTPTTMYVHGGGYLAGSAYGSSRPMAAVLSVACAQPILVPDYRLAPEHPYPAAVDDIEAAYKWMAAKAPDVGTVTVIADSSGAGLTMSMLQRLRATDHPMPARIALLSPWVDLECRFLEQADTADPQARSVRDSVDMCVPTYLGATRRDDPAVNPLHADLSGFPPMLIQAGTGDFILEEAKDLIDRASRFGVDAQLELYPAQTHVFHLFWSFLPEAAQAIEAVGHYLTRAHDVPEHPGRITSSGPSG